ncbi:MAG: ribbon-helix-helix domain-containing protein [Pseudomonadota bacterium]
MDRPEKHDKAARLAAYLSSPVVKRSVMIAGHATSVSLEQPFWDELQKIAKAESKSLNALITEIDDIKDGNLSSALRLYILSEVIRLEHHV